MSRGDLSIALKIQADVAEAVKRLGEVETELAQVSRAGNVDMGQGLSELAQRAALAAQSARTASAALAGATPALQQTANAYKAGALSAGQYQQAMRQLPMQITDVVTSLASGMPVWMVAIQQGGQIRDSFGGIGASIRAVGSLINPFTVAIGAAAAAVGGLALAYYQGSNESTRLATALIETGNYAGTTAGRLQEMAARVSEVTGTQRQAVAALEQLASSGKITENQFEKIASASVAMSNATGRSIKSITDEFIKLATGGSKAARELDERYHYLTAAVYKQIKALEEEGRAVDANTLSVNTYADALNGRAGQITNNLGSIERGWKAIQETAASAWDAMLDVGRQESKLPLKDQLELAKKRAANGGLTLRERAGGVMTGLFGGNAAHEEFYRTLAKNPNELNADVERLQAEIEAEDKKAEAAAAAARAAEAEKVATDEWGKIVQSNLTKQQRLEKEIAHIRAAGVAAKIDASVIATQEAAARQRYETKSPKKSDPVSSAYLSQQQSLTLALADAQNRLQNAKDGVAAADDKATTKLESWLTVNKNALKLDDTRIQALRALAAQTDAATRALVEFTEVKQRDERITKGMEGIDMALLRLDGKDAEAAQREFAARYKTLVEDLQKKLASGDAGAQLQIDAVIRLGGLEEAKRGLDALSSDIDKVFAAQSAAEQRIQAEVSAGLITEQTGRRQLIELHQKTAAAIESYLPTLREMAAMPGPMGEMARIQVQQLETELIRLKTTTDEFQVALKNGLEQGMGQAIAGLANGTLSLRDAITELVNSVAQGMAQLAAQRLAEQATAGLMGLFGVGAAGKGTDAAAGAVIGASITTASATGATEMAAAITSACAAGGASMASAIAGAAGASAGASAAANAAGAAASNSGWIGGLMSLFGFADGGYTGAGSKYQPAGVVHAGEFVSRQEVVRQPGALAFLNDFNAQGMAALERWATLNGYADGGFVTGLTVPDLSGTARQLAEPARASSTVQNAVNLHVYDDPERIAQAAFSSRAGQEHFATMLSRDPAKFRQILRID